MTIMFTDVHSKLHEYGTIYEVCPVDGKVERKIKQVKESFAKHLYNNRLSYSGKRWGTKLPIA